MLEQTLKDNNYSDEEIRQIMLVMNSPAAYQYAMQTGNFAGAYNMVKPREEEKPTVSLDDWFSSFMTDRPDDAMELSKGLTRFARYIQSQIDRTKKD